MKTSFLSVFMLFALSFGQPIAAKAFELNSHYVEKLQKNSKRFDLVKDFKAQTASKNNQSGLLQEAIDKLSKQGGGVLVIPAGSYYFADVYMKSNVHILVDSKATLNLYWGEKTKNAAMFHFSTPQETKAFIEDCSIRCLQPGKQYTVDYSYLKPHNQSGARFIICEMVRNFKIADARILDNFTKFCGIIFVPTKAQNVQGWEVTRPTHGEIMNCSIINASSGYGMCQLHGAQDLYFENLYAKGGVTLRLESGAGGKHAGVFDIDAKEVRSENGRAAVMMNPHATHNGIVRVDGVWAKSSSVALLLHKGFIDKKHKNDPNATVGSYDSKSEIQNVHAIYGTEAQVDDKEVFVLEPSAENYALFKNNSYGNTKSFIGPSLAVGFSTLDDWGIKISHVTSEGFTPASAKVVHVSDIADRHEQKWEILKKLPVTLRGDSPKQSKDKKEKPTKEKVAKQKGEKSTKQKKA